MTLKRQVFLTLYVKGACLCGVTSTLRDNRVREFRKRARLTQAELGAQVGVSRQSIVSTEKGDYAPSVYLALRLARSLGSTVEELFPLTEEGR
ncbi:putative transcriptional regulator [Rhodococcus sp. SMB37]|nr:putative transcriptional regulator [Rhodococcus sp. SMB37]